MRTLCFSVRLESLTLISEKCYKAVAFDGSEDLIPASQVFGPDYDVQKSEAYWISSWILERKNIQYSNKKHAWFDSETGEKFPEIQIEHHIPRKVKSIKTQPHADLTR